MQWGRRGRRRRERGRRVRQGRAAPGRQARPCCRSTHPGASGEESELEWSSIAQVGARRGRGAGLDATSIPLALLTTGLAAYSSRKPPSTATALRRMTRCPLSAAACGHSFSSLACPPRATSALCAVPTAQTRQRNSCDPRLAPGTPLAQSWTRCPLPLATEPPRIRPGHPALRETPALTGLVRESRFTQAFVRRGSPGYRSPGSLTACLSP